MSYSFSAVRTSSRYLFLAVSFLPFGGALSAVTEAIAQTDYEIPLMPTVGGSAGCGYGFRHASTVQEGAARGMADLIRSTALANLLHSAAASNYETASSKALDNRLKYAETFFEKRRVHAEYVAAKYRPPTSEQLRRMNQGSLPKRLGPEDLHPVTGSIRWPALLQSDEFAEDRQTLERLFEKAARYQYLDTEEYVQIQHVGSRMRQLLVEVIRHVVPRDHMRANAFLSSLLYEARLLAS